MPGVKRAHRIARVLELDPDLGDGITEREWEAALPACRAELVTCPRGRWEPASDPLHDEHRLAFVIVHGMICREAALADRHMLELLGPSDVLQPPVAAPRPRLVGRASITIVSDAVLLGLGRSFIRASARWPSLMSNLHRRLESQREHLAVQGLIAHLPRAEHRLLLILWHLSGTWGRVTAHGTLLSIPLTHGLLGQLAAARRSTVTLAMRALEAEGLIRRLDGGAWLLTPQAERCVHAIASTSSGQPAVGQMLMTRHRSEEVRRDAAAVRAEAAQVLHRVGARVDL